MLIFYENIYKTFLLCNGALNMLFMVIWSHTSIVKDHSDIEGENLLLALYHIWATPFD